MTPSSPLRPLTGACLAALAAGGALALSACGGDSEAKVVDASKGRPFQVSAIASFDRSQSLARTETLTIRVTNEERGRALPNVAVVLDGLTRDISSDDDGAGRVSDPRRPLWIVDEPPKGGTTAYVGTWALGRLEAGQQKVFRWKLTPVVAGKHRLRWRVAGGLDVDAPVRASGGPAKGRFDVVVGD
ncbi:hypothetical protein [Patulibacter sp. SYSU D01012]|uniref:hypothetical protein n=1 Tax=Patulibacter sp. SYSU D01012 TaxID=2817381 RepID=UPI001B3091E3|nr:hypothetical protein [Patulibacter sp. SYSU D01012]